MKRRLAIVCVLAGCMVLIHQDEGFEYAGERFGVAGADRTFSVTARMYSVISRPRLCWATNTST